MNKVEINMKRIVGCLYGIFLEKIMNKISSWTTIIEQEYLKYCRRGCENCYRWKCCHREKGKTPYKKFRKPPFPKSNEFEVFDE